MSCVPYDEHIEPDEDAQKQTSLEQTVKEPGFDEIKSCEDFEKVCSLFRGFMLGVFWRQVWFTASKNKTKKVLGVDSQQLFRCFAEE